MADDADRAQDAEAVLLAARLRVRAPVGPVPTGRCLHCGAPMPDLRRWCDADCRDAWQAHQPTGH